MLANSPRRDQDRTHDLTGVVYPAITVGIDLAQDAAQQVICIF